MARVYIDAHMFGENWFTDVLPELERDKGVRFSYSTIRKMKGEFEKQRKALEFYKRMGEVGRRDDANTGLMNNALTKLKQQTGWPPCNDCDDEHIFTLCAVMPTQFIFSLDKRLSRCRDRIKGAASADFVRFKRVGSAITYKAKKAEIHS